MESVHRDVEGDEEWEGEDEACEGREQGASMEREFEAEPLAAWWEQITVRSLVASVILGTLFSVVAMKLNLTSGFVPSLAIPAGLLSFFSVRSWTHLLHHYRLSHLPFTRQENTLIQACVVACSAMAMSGGFGTYVMAMSKDPTDKEYGMDEAINAVEPSLSRTIAFLFLVSFAGLFAIVPLREVMIIRHRLTYPSGMATAHLINSFHTPHGANKARQQVSLLFKSLGGTVMWSLFRWFYSAGKDCGFEAFPTFGLFAYKYGFNYDFSLTNMGLGMVCPHMITVSMLIGSVISWGMMRKYSIMVDPGAGGRRYTSGYGDPNFSMYHTINQVFVGATMILVDGIFSLISILLRTFLYNKRCRQAPQPHHHVDRLALSFDDRRRTQIFRREHMSGSVAAACYAVLSVLSIVVIPQLYPQLKFYHVALAYLVAPVFAFCNAYSFGITDISLTGTYGKLSIMVFGAWVGSHGGVVAGLAACGIMMGIISSASDLMQDLKTGYLTLTSPRAMLVSQVVGTTLGCVINPVVFWVFYKVYSMAGLYEMSYIPYARVYRWIAMLGTVGQEVLPPTVVLMCKWAFVLTLCLSMAREAVELRRWRFRHYIPSTMGMAVAFFVSPNMPIGMGVGSLLRWFLARSRKRAEAEEPMSGRQRQSKSERVVLMASVASGLICGDGLGSLMVSVMTLFDAHPPICIKFLSAKTNDKVDVFLKNGTSSQRG